MLNESHGFKIEDEGRDDCFSRMGKLQARMVATEGERSDVLKYI
jgi:hypothetical protein